MKSKRYTKKQIEEAIRYWQGKLDGKGRLYVLRDISGDKWLATEADTEGKTGKFPPLTFGTKDEAVNAMWKILEQTYGENAREYHESDMDEENGHYFFDMEEGEYEEMTVIGEDEAGEYL